MIEYKVDNQKIETTAHVIFYTTDKRKIDLNIFNLYMLFIFSLFFDTKLNYHQEENTKINQMNIKVQ